jgi:hypothetical protein
VSQVSVHLRCRAPPADRSAPTTGAWTPAAEPPSRGAASPGCWLETSRAGHAAASPSRSHRHHHRTGLQTTTRRRPLREAPDLAMGHRIRRLHHPSSRRTTHSSEQHLRHRRPRPPRFAGKKRREAPPPPSSRPRGDPAACSGGGAARNNGGSVAAARVCGGCPSPTLGRRAARPGSNFALISCLPDVDDEMIGDACAALLNRACAQCLLPVIVIRTSF